MKNPKVSIIIPVYNAEKYIKDALDSALSQTYKNTEIICVNDCSTDDTGKIIKSYIKKNPKISYVKMKKNTGNPIVPRNTGIEKATGEYILPLDADDKIAPSYIAKAVNEMQKSSADVVYCKANLFGEKKGRWKLKPYSSKKILFGNMVFISALFRRSDWIKYGGYSKSMTNGLEDWDFWLHFVRDKKKFVRLNEILFFYRVLKGSRTSIAIDNKKELIRKIKRKHASLYTIKDYYFTWQFLRLFLKNLRYFILRINLKKNRKIIRIFGIDLV